MNVMTPNDAKLSAFEMKAVEKQRLAEERKLKSALKRKRDEERKNHLFVPGTVQLHLDIWNSYGVLKKVVNNGTKRFESDLKSLKAYVRGSLFDGTEFESFMEGKYNIDNFRFAVSRFSISASDPGFYPLDKKPLVGMTIKDFFLNPHSKVRSAFILHLKHPPRPLASKIHIPERDYIMAATIIRKYAIIALDSREYAPATSDFHKFLDAASKLIFFLDKRRSMYRIEDYQAAEYLVKAVAKDIGDPGRMSPGYLCSDDTFNRRLPNYLKDVAEPVKRKILGDGLRM